MIIDCHAHIYAFETIKPYKWLRNKSLTVEEQIEIMDSQGIDKSIVLPFNSAEMPSDHQSFGEVLYICKKYPARFIPFCNIDPRATDVGEMKGVEKFEFWLNQYKDLGCKGLGEFTPRLRWQDCRVENLLKACENVGFPVTFHTSTEDVITYGVIDDMGLPGLEGALKKFPDLKFFGHSQAFWSELSGDLPTDNKNSYPKGKVTSEGAVVKFMRKYPNLYADISAGSGLNALERDPDFTWRFIEEFQDRVLLGLDNTSKDSVSKLNQVQWLRNNRDKKNISADIFEKIAWKNINDILGLRLG
jgi:hypothetical protein